LHLVCGRVFNSCGYFPKELKNIFCLLRENCLKYGKSDEMCDMLISASIFLRFICPAILSPNLFNLTQGILFKKKTTNYLTFLHQQNRISTRKSSKKVDTSCQDTSNHSKFFKVNLKQKIN
jgi:hypothetical protein